MATVNYFLRAKQTDNTEVSVWAGIFISKSEKANRVQFQVCTDIKVPAKAWDAKTRRLFSPKAKFEEQERYKSINEDLDNLRLLLISEIAAYDIYTPAMARDAIRRFISHKSFHASRAPIEIIPFIKWIIDRMENGIEMHKGKCYEHNTIKEYGNILHVMESFADYFRKETGTSLCWDSFSLRDTANCFMTFLEKSGYKTSSRNKYISLSKSVLRLAKREGLHSHDGDKELYKIEEHSEEAKAKIYLRDDEIEALYNMPLEPGSFRDKVRDVFLVGCYTGQRISDYGRLSKENFIISDNGIRLIKLQQKKTKRYICIPVINDHLSEIIKKYEGELPIIVPQDLNRDIKLILKDLSKTIPSLADYKQTSLTMLETDIESSQKKHFKRNEFGHVVKHRYELVSSHTARRSCLTNLYKLNQFSTKQLMSISGHTSEKTFYEYILLSDEEMAEEISKKLNLLRKQGATVFQSNEAMF